MMSFLSFSIKKCPHYHIKLLQPRLAILFNLQRNAHSSAGLKNKIFITTPIFYVNAAPHIGHVYSAVLADIASRFNKLIGNSVKLSTGTDEHGQKDLFDSCNISYTDYIRTTDTEHKRCVEKFWNILVENGYIYKGTHSGWYSISDEAFYTDNQIKKIKNKKGEVIQVVSIETGSVVEYITEDNYKFKLSAFQKQLEELVNSGFIEPLVRRNEVIGMLKQGLQDISVSRPVSRISWGIPVPNDNSQTIYVWIDALINYLTVDGNISGSNHSNNKSLYTSDSDNSPGNLSSSRILDSLTKETFALNYFPPDYQILGKDIIRFHAIFWPAFLMAANLPVPKKIISHAHWTMENFKMSKSRGNVADPVAAIEKYGPDGLRYFLARTGSLSSDSDYSEKNVAMRYNKELADHLGNLLSRCLSSKLNVDLKKLSEISISYKSKNSLNVKDHLESKDECGDMELIRRISDFPGVARPLYQQFDFKAVLEKSMELLSAANKHFSDNVPWELVKNGQIDRLHNVIYLSLEAIRVVTVVISPVIPSKSEAILDYLLVPKNKRIWESSEFGYGFREINDSDKLSQDITPLFTKIK
ncbi:putative methionine-tRNA ligase, mitochondrial [Smittium culicis]|uniref:Probable methionine--tRNA ligase, mitochondrial n=1 Tax=Smittium culicis TaxID=133412 RepID=A0A1R1XP22_9FUNG|nr:putative methionine-tRNA ligase, mitochondrial [Smittium culicis]